MRKIPSGTEKTSIMHSEQLRHAEYISPGMREGIPSFVKSNHPDQRACTNRDYKTR